jgi:MOSC domain-containing protein YiiM
MLGVVQMQGAGRIFQINVSPGGVPKLGRPAAWIDAAGVEDDRQATPEVHGGPDRAVCLYSLERILALQTEGHPIFPGAIGENLTISGLDWEQVVPGKKLHLGNGVLIEVTKYTSPCNSIAGAFMEREYGRVSQNGHPGWSRVYARVLRAGKVQVGDLVSLVSEDGGTAE